MVKRKMKRILSIIIATMAIILLAACNEEKDVSAPKTVKAENNKNEAVSKYSNLSKHDLSTLNSINESQKIWDEFSEKEKQEAIDKVNKDDFSSSVIAIIRTEIQNPGMLSDFRKFKYTNTGSFEFNDEAIKKTDVLFSKLDPLADQIKKDLGTQNLGTVIVNAPVPKRVEKETSGPFPVYDITSIIEFEKNGEKTTYELFLKETELNIVSVSMRVTDIEYKKIN